MQLKIDKHNDIVFEWIPYNQFNDIKETGKGGLYSAVWKNGSLYYDEDITKEYKRYPDTKVALKCLYNSQNISEFLNKV